MGTCGYICVGPTVGPGLTRLLAILLIPAIKENHINDLGGMVTPHGGYTFPPTQFEMH